jgi:tRNA (guanine-N7-)-methyltransferase
MGRNNRIFRETAVAYEVRTDLMKPLDLAEVFGRVAPVEVDLGCGDGAFLAALATQNPTRDFLGTERLFGRVRSACAKADRGSLANFRVVRVESAYAVQFLLRPESVSVFHLRFPDPWPKRRHHRRRLVTKEFLAALQHALAPGGFFHVATDQSDYFECIRSLATSAGFDQTPPPTELPRSTFEEHFQRQGAPIYRASLRKVS